MKRVWLPLLLAMLLFCTTALADDAGVLTETELGTWLNGVLLSTMNVAPINTPVGEESLTTDGYAFMYNTVTLYYDKPVLDAQSKLQAIAVTDEALDMPRGIRLGAPADMLLTVYGWQNPTLAGDDSFARLYVLNQLPNAAYWALAQRGGDQLQSVQCAIHARAGENRYTDTGILYTVQNGTVSGIRVYGLNAFITQAQVENNLSAVGDEQVTTPVQAATGITEKSDAEAFGQSDLQFNRMDFFTLTEKGAAVLFGESDGESWAQDDQGEWLHTLSYSGASLVFVMDANRENPHLESVALSTGKWIGPRGVVAGSRLDAVMALFLSDGTGAVNGGEALLYGDGQNPPFGTLERTDSDAKLRYAATVTGADGSALRVALHMTFVNEKLAELMIYRF